MGVKLAAALGGSVELVPTNTASNYTATMPAKTGTVAMDGPAFSYTQSVAIALVSNTSTKITYTTQEFDTTSGMYATSRFTPTVAGYYQINGSVTIATTQTALVCSVYKNGTEYKRGTYGSAVSNTEVTAVVYLNGSTDYVEIYGTSISITQNTNPGAVSTFFQGCLIRGA